MRLERLTARYNHSLPSDLQLDPYRRIYYAYLYAYIRHCVREKLGVKNVYYLLTSDEEERIFLPNVSTFDLYHIVTSTFPEVQISPETADAIKQCIPSDELITTLVSLLQNEPKVSYDIMHSNGDHRDVGIFMTLKTIFLLEVGYSLDTANYMFRWYQFKCRYPHLEKMAIIGITDSTLTMVYL